MVAWDMFRGVFVPSRGFLFFYNKCEWFREIVDVFVPSRGFLFFYDTYYETGALKKSEFSSPHGDFSFSIVIREEGRDWSEVFVPSRGFLFFY